MSDLIAGFSASSSYSSYASATRYSNPYQGISHTSASLAQEASFSFDAVLIEDHSNPIVSLPFAEGEKSSDDMMSQLQEKLEGFFEPFGYKGEELAEVVGTALQSLADLVEDTSVDAASLSIDIRLARVEESYSTSGYQRGAGVFSGFALEINVSTTTVDYDPGRSVVINTTGSKIEFSETQLIEGHKRGIFRRAAPGLQNFPGFNQELADQTREILEFLKDTRKQLKAFSREEEHGYRHHLHHALKGHNHFNMRT
ncbi:hypothetical protein [Sneathiella limimaris]|uniref:hypothetical protein n=1 Tax=Sneathiella limimaris TaxID=1964213 RepID=UPI00146F69DB|nr:hypothetical protein [Sneathiella limimaris]